MIDRIKLIDAVDCMDAYRLKNGQPVALAQVCVRLVEVGFGGGVAVEAPARPAVECVLHRDEM